MTERLTDRELARWLECAEDHQRRDPGDPDRTHAAGQAMRSQATELLPRLLAEVKERREAERHNSAGHEGHPSTCEACRG